MSVTPPLTWANALTFWDVPIAVVVLVVLAAVGYLLGARRVADWPKGCTAAFFGALAVILVAAGSSVNAYSDVLFVMHMAQHLLLITVAPALLVLGRPAELVRRLTGRASLHTPLAHPAVGFLAYAAVVAGTHLTDFAQAAATSPGLHALEEVLYLASGYLLLVPIIGGEPLRRPLPHLVRLVLLLVSMLVDTVVGVALLMTGHMPFPAYRSAWGPPPTTDLHWGGAMMWVGGDLLMVLIAVLVIGQWVRSPAGSGELGGWLESARRSAVLGEADARPSRESPDSSREPEGMDDDEDALRAYNAMLARLADSERRSDR